MVVVAAVEDSDDPTEVLRGEALVVERVRHVPRGGEGQDGRLHSALHRLGRTIQVQTKTGNVGEIGRYNSKCSSMCTSRTQIEIYNIIITYTHVTLIITSMVTKYENSYEFYSNYTFCQFTKRCPRFRVNVH